jgi:hypothetical protein
MVSPAWAVVLLPGETAGLPGTTQVTTVVQQVDRTVTFTDDTTIYGDITVRDTVTRNADGTLNFQFQIINTSLQEPLLFDARVYGLLGWQTDVNYDSASMGVTFPRSADRDVGGDDIGFGDWTLSRLAIGEMSKVAFIGTNAADYGLTGRLSLRIGVGANTTFPSEYLSVFGPMVPEPATLALLAMLLPAALLRRQA